MHRKLGIILLSLPTAMLVLSDVHAAGKMKPGLWEMSMKSDAMREMPKIPPEQLEKMKQMGIKMPLMENGAITHQICITREMAERDHPPMAQKEQSMCKPLNINQSGNSYTMDLICDSQELKGKGTVRGSFNGSSNLRSVYDFKGTSRGRPVVQHMETTGKWLSADCGKVKPLGDPSRKP